MGDCKILSYNVKALQNREKIIKIFDYCKEKGKNGIVMLQKTYSCSKDVVKWENEWGSDVFFKSWD